MSTPPCDPIVIQRYLDGVLGEEDCSRFEAHALECEACKNAVELGLAPAERWLADSFRPLVAPISLDHLAIERTRQRKLSPFLILAPLAAGIAWLAVSLPRADEDRIRLVSRAPNVVERKAADSSEFVVIDSAIFDLQGVSVRAKDARFDFRSDGATSWVTLHSGRLEFDGRGQYEVRLPGGRKVRPAGTRFSVESRSGIGSAVGVFESSVVLSGIGQIREGWSFGADGNRSLLEDDPTTIKRGDPVPLPALSGLRWKRFDGPRTALKPADVSRLNFLFRQRPSLEVLMQVAGVCSELEAIGPAGAAMLSATKMDPQLETLPTVNLLDWTLRQATLPGDKVLADRLAKILASRPGHREIATEIARYCAATRGDRTRWAVDRANSCARRIDKLAGRDLPSLVGRLLFEAGYAPSHVIGECDARSLDLARVRLTSALAAGSSSPQSSARDAHDLAEALYFLGSRLASNEALEKAVRLDPRPHWRAHLAARLMETSPSAGALRKAMAHLEAALASEPSYPSFERALVVLQIASEQKLLNDALDQMRVMSAWIGRAFGCVRDANARISQLFAGPLRDSAKALTYMERACDIAGGEDGLAPHDRDLLAKLRGANKP